ncbi:hypothetical protein BX616_009060, partial [Lobosporangium transversale]
VLSGVIPEFKEFLHDIKKYNASLSFTSIGVNVDQALANGQDGAYTFRIQGTVVHRIGSLTTRGLNMFQLGNSMPIACKSEQLVTQIRDATFGYLDVFAINTLLT